MSGECVVNTVGFVCHTNSDTIMHITRNYIAVKPGISLQRREGSTLKDLLTITAYCCNR